MLQKNRKVNVNEINFNVIVKGSGDAVILLHGFGDTANVWHNQIDYLVVAGFKVIAPDLRGFGGTDAPEWKENYEIEKLASDVKGLADEFGVDDFHLVAHGFSTIVGWYLAEHYPEKLKSMVIISMGHPGSYEDAGIEQLQKGWYRFAFLLPGIAEKQISLNNWEVLRKLFGNHRQVKQIIKNISRSGRITSAMNWYRANVIPLYTGEFPGLAIPLLGCWGEHDPVFLEEQMKNTKKFSNGKWHYVKIENAGYWPQLDRPDLLNNLIGDWITYKYANK